MKIKSLPYKKKEQESYQLTWEEEKITVIPIFLEDGEEIKKEFLEEVKEKISKKWKIEGMLWYEPQLAERCNSYQQIFPLSFLMYVYQKLPFSDTIYIKEDGTMELEEFVGRIYDDCNKMVIWIPQEEKYEDGVMKWEYLGERIYQNSGLLLELIQRLPKEVNFEKDKWKENYQPLFFDFSMHESISYREVPKGSIYVDFFPKKQKRKVLTQKRNDLTYLTYANFLDKNGENTV